MQKTKKYINTWFKPEVIKEAYELFCGYLDTKQKSGLAQILSISISQSESWKHNNDEEFFADYRKCSWDADYAHYSKYGSGYDFDLSFSGSPYIRESAISIKAPTRKQIEALFEIFERYLPESKLPEIPKPEPPKPIIFIGHGGSKQWSELKDHLHDKHSYEIEAYEIGARAGHEIRDILEDMLDKSSFAILVMTGEDKDAEGKIHARENVIHELGLFQGKLGFDKAIILLEEGTEEFSNIKGINQIRFSKGNIKETFGDVLATLKRELGK